MPRPRTRHTSTFIRHILPLRASCGSASMVVRRWSGRLAICRSVADRHSENAGAGGFARAQPAGTGESAFATRYAGQGEVWTEATPKHFILAQMDGRRMP
jgi:uncharacterized protein (AIM24 family)